MNVYFNEKQKTSRRFLGRLCLQTVGAIGVFFMVLSLFHLTVPEAVPLQQTVRACFTSDTDITPVIEWFENTSTNTDTDAIRANASGY